MREKLPELFDPTTTIVNARVRVVMNSQGTLVLAVPTVLMYRNPDGSLHRTNELLKPSVNLPARFAELGVQPRDIEATGSVVTVGPAAAQRVSIDYAWLRRGAAIDAAPAARAAD